MTAGGERRVLVIDASVLHGAGSAETQSEHAAKLRDFLQMVLVICHRSGITLELGEEWRQHCSPYAGAWQTAMARAGKRPALGPGPDSARQRALDAAPDEHVRAIMAKDWHLVEAALQADKVIVSCDDRARFHYSAAAAVVADLRQLTWVSLNRCDMAEIEQWLHAGAGPWPKWAL